MIEAGLLQPIARPLEQGLVQPLRPATVLQAGLVQPLRSAVQLQAGLVQPLTCTRELQAGLLQPITFTGVVESALVQPFAVAGQILSAGLVQPFAVLDRNILESALVQPFSDLGGYSGQQLGPTVTAGGVEIHPEDIVIRGTRDGDVIECTLSLPDPEDAARCVPVDIFLARYSGAERQAIIDGSTLVIAAGGVDRIFIITDVSRARNNGTTYTVSAASETILLDAPYARPLLQSFEPGLASDIAASLLAGSGIDFNWNIVDDYIPADTLYANGETPLAVLKKPVNQYGCILQSSIDGSLAAVNYYPYPLPQWATAPVDYYLADGDFVLDDDEQPDGRPGYNRYLVGNELQSSDSITMEEKNISSTVKEIHAFETPWSGDIPAFATSGPDRVLIRAPEIITETITEQVEFVAGQARTSKPIYTMVERDYGENTQLGAISFSESGELVAELSGQTLCNLTYVTRYWSWRVSDAVAEDVQFYASPVWGEVPVTIVVRFGDAVAAAGFILVEPDSSLNVDADGEVKTEFAPGEVFNFLVQHDDTIRVAGVRCSSGSVVCRGLVARTRELQQQFVDDQPVELPSIPSGAVSASWYGRSPALSLDARAVTPSDWPAVAELSWPALMTSYGLVPPAMTLGGDEDYYILVVLEVESV